MNAMQVAELRQWCDSNNTNDVARAIRTLLDIEETVDKVADETLYAARYDDTHMPELEYTLDKLDEFADDVKIKLKAAERETLKKLLKDARDAMNRIDTKIDEAQDELARAGT